MNRNRYGRSVVFLTVFCLLTAAAYGQRVAINKVKWAKEFVFKGIVENVDPNAQSVTVSSENIPAGWLNSVFRYGMTPMNIRMTYKVDNPEVLKTLKPGDHVTANVLEGDFKVLYDLKVAPPEDTPVFFPKK
jgi:Cu/Ag efflux protein CusF